MTFVIKHDRPNCIGCSACEAIAPSFWTMCADGKVDLVDSSSQPKGWQKRVVDKTAFELNKDAAIACPVNVIHVEDVE